MIELLCVITIVSTLGTTAMGSFLDFRNEARRAQLQAIVRNIASGIRTMSLGIKLRCPIGTAYNLTHFYWPGSVDPFIPCDLSHIPVFEQQYMDNGLTLRNTANPFTNTGGIWHGVTEGAAAPPGWLGTAASISTVMQSSCSFIYGPPGGFILYMTPDLQRGVIIPNSNLNGECALIQEVSL